MRIPDFSPKASLISLLVLFPILLKAQLPVRVDGEKIKSIIAEIASDEYQGRETGSPGCEMAEEYFAAEFKKLGLKPLGDSGSYFYHYTVPNEEFDVKPTLVIDERSFYYGYGEDFSDAQNSDRGEAEAEIVFAGYGIYNPDMHRNDFDSIDIRNKVVLIRRGAPENDIAGWRPSCIDSVKVEYCYKQGALGILFYDPVPRSNPQLLFPNYSNHLANVSKTKSFPVFLVDERVVRFILSKSGQAYYRVSYMLDNQVLSFNTGRKCVMKAIPGSRPLINTRNVIGMIQGNDRKLKNEYILIGGHIDHIGKDDAGNIRNGADDNASGPAVALGIAQAMVKNGFRPKRSIVFVGWTGEEMGLLGSKAWCEKPTIDLKKIVVYFNLDMVGLGNGILNMPGTEFAPEVYDFIKNNLDSAVLKKINWSKGGLGGSDHNHFLKHGVPAFAGMTAGSHPDYHQPADDPDKLKAEILQLTGDFIYCCTEKIATANKQFLSPGRRDENKVKLVNYNIFIPVYSKNFRNELQNSTHRIGIIDFSDNALSGQPKENFVSLLLAFDSTLLIKKTADNLTLRSTPYEARANRSGMLAAFNPDVISGDEFMFRVLAKYGYRLALIGMNSPVLSDTGSLARLMRLSKENGVGFILDNLDIPVLAEVITHLSGPCLVLCHDASALPDTIIKTIKEKDCLLVFQPVPAKDPVSNLTTFRVLLGKTGKEHITITPADITEAGLKCFRDFLLAFITDFPDEEFQYSILTGNFMNVAAKSLQINR